MKPIHILNIVGAAIALGLTMMAIKVAVESSARALEYERAFEESRAMYEELQRTRGVINSNYICKKRLAVDY